MVPLLQQHCYACHGPDEQSDELRLDRLTADFALRENAATWVEVRDKINRGEMPPAGEPPLPSEQIQSISR
ncbi:c-type cytochrome domain-containing protein [Allorhodopirellula solitaria]|uniref:Planctomycete cytochrome C n=1 Tax=Allorhodopirellula solitaria TaxID=2527987 RepID=A0A5C5YJI3_9BACT|nr:c-type cytochrome domain-containing protein [Allorhodopirellula solitaria]TWT75051.1 Planctomycete cytochrome C [Allorhodopirellula solitaria]